MMKVQIHSWLCTTLFECMLTTADGYSARLLWDCLPKGTVYSWISNSITERKGNTRKEHGRISKIAKFGGEILRTVWNTASKSLQIFYMIVLRAEMVTIFQPELVTISARNTTIHKIYKLCIAIFPTLYSISQLNFMILLILLCSLWLLWFVFLYKWIET